MVKLSGSTLNKIKEQIILTLYEKYPKSYTAKAIGREIGRDNELIGRLLDELKKNKVVILNVKKSKFFKYYRLSDVAKRIYDKKL